MSAKDFYVSYEQESSHHFGNTRQHGFEILDNGPALNAKFKLFDDFTTNLRVSNNTRLSDTSINELIQDSYTDRTNNISYTLENMRQTGDDKDSGVDKDNGNQLDYVAASTDNEMLENEVLVDHWSSMDSSNSPITDSGPSVSEDYSPSTSSEPPRIPPHPPARNEVKEDATKKKQREERTRPVRLDLEEDPPRRRNFLHDYENIKATDACRIPKPHFLDCTPSPDELDEKSDITNPNFLDDDENDEPQNQRRGAVPKKPERSSRVQSSPYDEHRPHPAHFRSPLHYGLHKTSHSSERDKRASQLYRGTWPGEAWQHDTSSVRSFSSNGSDAPRPSSKLDNKVECVYSLLSLLSLSPDNNADLSGTLLEMSRSAESCIAMRQAGCIPLLVQLIHSKQPRDTRDRAAKALRNIIHCQTDDKAGRREARVWRLLEQVREYCYFLEDAMEMKCQGGEIKDDDSTKYPSQSVAALMKLSFDEEHRHVVCQFGGLQALAGLVSGDQAVHGNHTDDNTCLTMRKYAGMTLTNLTFGDGNNKSLLCSFKDFMMALVDQLESPNDDMRQVTAAVLRNLSWRADSSSKQILREVGAVSGLTKAAMSCQKEATLKSILSALWNLTAHCSMNKVALCSVDGALGFLVDMLSYNSPSKTLAIVENAGGIMRNVSSHIAVREDYRQILRERNCLSVLLQHLKSPSLTVVSNSCGTLWNLSARCPLDQQFLWDHGAIPMLRSLIHSKHKMIAMGSSAALKNLLNSKPGKNHIINLDSTARSMNLPVLPTLGARKQKALEQELDHNLAETCDNIEPVTSPSTSNRDEKNLFSATEKQIAMNLERHRMTSSSPMMGGLTSQTSLSHSAHLAGYLSCSNTLLKGTLNSRAASTSNSVDRSDSKDSVASAQSDSAVMRTGKVPIPTPRTKDLKLTKPDAVAFKQPPVPPPRNLTDVPRTNYVEAGFDIDQDASEQPVDYSRKYTEKSTDATDTNDKPAQTDVKKKDPSYGDYQETDLDQPTDYSLRYAEHHSGSNSDVSEPPASVHEDTIKHFCTEGTPYETPVIFSNATSMSDLRVIGNKDAKKPQVKQNVEVMTNSDEKDTCSIEDQLRPDNDAKKKGTFDTKFSSGMVSPEKPVNYCDEGTPGYFSRVSSLSSLGENDDMAKKNAMASMNIDAQDENIGGSAKDKDGSKAVTFATELSQPATPGLSTRTTSPPGHGFVEDTPLMFSRTSSLGSLSGCEPQDDHGSVISEVSRLTSGCISPSEIPDSPGQSMPQSPRSRRAGRAEEVKSADKTAPPTPGGLRSVFEEQVYRFQVENTPAHFSLATSLSSLTIDDDKPSAQSEVGTRDASPKGSDSGRPCVARMDDHRAMLADRSQSLPQQSARIPTVEEPSTPGNQLDACTTYCTEDTPALLSKCGSNSNLSALSIDTGGATGDKMAPARHDTSDSSNLSDGGENLLEECIQKGIAKVVKNGQNLERPCSVTSGQYLSREDLYRSLPPYLRSSTETVKMSQERNVASDRDLARGQSASPPALLPRGVVPPPRAPPSPPLSLCSDDERILHSAIDSGIRNLARERKHQSRAPVKSQTREKAKAISRDIDKNDSLSSLSIESFGSTDREIFEECIKAGLSTLTAENTKVKAHSVERPSDSGRPHQRYHKSLDRSDRITHLRARLELDTKHRYGKERRPELPSGSSITRSPFSYHGDTAGSSLAHHSRNRVRRFLDDGPNSLPSRVDDKVHRLERSSSLGSLSNDSFGSTDKEVFERTVRLGMAKAVPRNEDKSRLLKINKDQKRSKPEAKSKAEVKSKPQLGALDKMVGEDTKDRMLLEEVIARGAGEKVQAKNVEAPSAISALADGNAKPALMGMPMKNGFDNSVAEMIDDRFRSHAISEIDGKIPSTDGEHRDRISQSRPDRANSNQNQVNRIPIEMVMPNIKLPCELQIHETSYISNAESDSTIEYNDIPRPQIDLNVTETSDSAFDTTGDSLLNNTGNTEINNEELANYTDSEIQFFDVSNEMPVVDSGNTTFESIEDVMDMSNECMAFRSANTTFDSEVRDELNQSNESYAEVFNSSWSDGEGPFNQGGGTLTRKNKSQNVTEQTEVKKESDHKLSKTCTDTWNDNTVPDDVTFPTISGSVPMVSSYKSDMGDFSNALPDLLEESILSNRSLGPDLTDKLKVMTNSLQLTPTSDLMSRSYCLDNIPEPSFNSLIDENEPRVDSLQPCRDIEKEAARLAAQLKIAEFDSNLAHSMISMNSLELENIKPPSNFGSLVSLTQSASACDDIASFKRSPLAHRKKSMPVSLLVKRALTNSMSHHDSSENVSFLDNVKPPIEMDHMDLENSLLPSSSNIADIDSKEPRLPPPVFDLKQPIIEFPMFNKYSNIVNDLDGVNPPSLFDEIAESTLEMDQTTAQQVFDEVSSTLNLVTDILSGSENCSPLPSDISSMESTPKRNPKYLTPKEKRQMAKDRYQTYTINDLSSENDATLEINSDFTTYIKTNDDSDSISTARSDTKSKKKISAKQRRLDDRARYQTQTVDIGSLVNSNLQSSDSSIPDPQIQNLKERLASKKTLKQKRLDDAERFRTRTLSGDIPPSPTYVTKDASFENVETTTGYDSLSSTEPDDKMRISNVDYSRAATSDSGNNEDDCELNTAQFQTYTKSFRNYLPVTESPAAVDLCVVKNLKNLEMSASYGRDGPAFNLAQVKDAQNPSSSDFASVEGDSRGSDSEEPAPVKSKAKITKPFEPRRAESVDSNGSVDNDDAKSIRGRKKTVYVSPYRRTAAVAKKPITTNPVAKPGSSKPVVKQQTRKVPTKPATRNGQVSSNPSSPKKTPIPKSATYQVQKPSNLPPIQRQGTFVKQASAVSQDQPEPGTSKTLPKQNPQTSPSRLPQPKTIVKQSLKKTPANEVPKRISTNRSSMPAMRNSASNHSLQSNDSTKTVTLAGKPSRHNSTNSVNSGPSNAASKEINSRISSLWKRVDQAKRQPTKPDKRVWIGGAEAAEVPRLIRSNTFDGPANSAADVQEPKAKSSIAIRASQIPSSRYARTPQRPERITQLPTSSRLVTNRLATRKPLAGK